MTQALYAHLNNNNNKEYKIHWLHTMNGLVCCVVLCRGGGGGMNSDSVVGVGR
jgi:hypothetical protein